MDESQHIFCKKEKKSLEEYVECKPTYLKFKETCTINKLLRNTHLRGKVIKETKESNKESLKRYKNVFRKLSGRYKFDHFIIFI